MAIMMMLVIRQILRRRYQEATNLAKAALIKFPFPNRKYRLSILQFPLCLPRLQLISVDNQ
jgi:hypothetical protein